jgi:hypothetical protein
MSSSPPLPPRDPPHRRRALPLRGTAEKELFAEATPADDSAPGDVTDDAAGEADALRAVEEAAHALIRPVPPARHVSLLRYKSAQPSPPRARNPRHAPPPPASDGLAAHQAQPAPAASPTRDSVQSRRPRESSTQPLMLPTEGARLLPPACSSWGASPTVRSPWAVDDGGALFDDDCTT